MMLGRIVYEGIAYRMKGELDKAIEDYNLAIEREPDFGEAYISRAEAWLHLKEWEKAKADLTVAKDMGIDIIASFHNDYKSVEEFEKKNGVQLPEDIEAMLTQW